MTTIKTEFTPAPYTTLRLSLAQAQRINDLLLQEEQEAEAGSTEALEIRVLRGALDVAGEIDFGRGWATGVPW